MILIALSAAFVGFVHSLAPGHWLPVVITAKGQRWGLGRALLGAATLAAGHVVVSTLIGGAAIGLGRFLYTAPGDEERLEHYAALMLVAFGLVYAGLAYFRHSTCHGHEHHTPVPPELAGEPAGEKSSSSGRRAPFLFLFSVGHFPCVAVLPIFLAAAALGPWSVGLSMLAFSLGVLVSLASSTAVATLGLLKLDHPIFEHHGDLITGLAVAVMGGIIDIFPV